MPDREKVSGFELCANGEPCIGVKFMKCPFSPRNNNEQNCGVTMARFALALLKEQEAVVPQKHYNKKADLLYTCGKCHNDLKPNNRNAKFCWHCGRAVNWEDLK